MTAKSEAAPHAWVVTIDGREIGLIPSVPNLIAIEKFSGCTVLSLVQAGGNGDLSIEQLAVILLALADVPHGDDSDPLFGRAKQFTYGSLAMSPGAFMAPIQNAIVEAGIMAVMPRLIVPVAAALAGKTTAAGGLKAEA